MLHLLAASSQTVAFLFYFNSVNGIWQQKAAWHIFQSWKMFLSKTRLTLMFNMFKILHKLKIKSVNSIGLFIFAAVMLATVFL